MVRVWDVHIRHLIQDLAHEDSVVPHHRVPRRLFKIEDDLHYPLVEHPVLQGNFTEVGNCDVATIFHLAYIPNLWQLKKRYENHLAKSNMHTPEYLKDWYEAHLFGVYPRKHFNIEELPEIILNEFGIDKEELYFRNRRNLDIKHFLDAIYLKEFLTEFENPRVMEFGCGMGMRVWCMNKVGLSAHGNELSEYAVKKSFILDKVKQGDITKGISKFDDSKYSLTMAYDVLEHLSYEDLDKGIDTLMKNTEKYILVSVPVIGDPNLEADYTHLIKETKEWWVKQFTDKKLKQIEAPSHFLYKEQLMIFEKSKTN